MKHALYLVFALVLLAGQANEVYANGTDDGLGEASMDDVSLTDYVVEITIEGTYYDSCPIAGGVEIWCYITTETCATVIWDTDNQQYLVLDDQGNIKGAGSTYSVSNGGTGYDEQSQQYYQKWEVSLGTD